ncbi:hypothetical protein BH11BAC3_BH11BAC3_34780 [soil metagenome]
MGYINIVIPLFAGLLLLAIPGKLIKTRDATYEKKKSLLKIAGYVIIVVAVLYFVVIAFG